MSFPYNATLLTQPISDEFPSGQDIRTDRSAFRQLRNQFNIAQTSLRKIIHHPDAEDIDLIKEKNKTNWQELHDLLLKTFETTTRDIELISWYCVAQVILDNSLTQLVNSLRWFVTLIETNWDNINPCIYEYDKSEQENISTTMVLRRKAFTSFIGDSEQSTLFYTPVLQVHLCHEFLFFDYQSAEKKGSLTDFKQSCASYIAAERNEIQVKIDNTSEIVNLINALDVYINNKTTESHQARINFHFVKNLFSQLTSALMAISGLYPSKQQDTLSESAHDDETGESSPSIDQEIDQQSALLSSSAGTTATTTCLHVGENNLHSVMVNNGMNRDLAFRQLRTLSDYFRRSEPHSPVSYLLEKAIRWGYMPLPELLQAMAAEASTDGNWLDNVMQNAGLTTQGQIELPQIPVQPSPQPLRTVSVTSTTQTVSNTPTAMTMVSDSLSAPSDTPPPFAFSSAKPSGKEPASSQQENDSQEHSKEKQTQDKTNENTSNTSRTLRW